MEEKEKTVISIEQNEKKRKEKKYNYDDGGGDTWWEVCARVRIKTQFFQGSFYKIATNYWYLWQFVSYNIGDQ